jgi:hypothetical protein
MDLHLPGLPQFRQDSRRRSYPAQEQVRLEPDHHGDPGCPNGRRYSMDHVIHALHIHQILLHRGGFLIEKCQSLAEGAIKRNKNTSYFSPSEF